MTIEDDKEYDLSPIAPWPVKAARFLEERPRTSAVSAVLIVAVVASLATQLRPADLPVPAPTAAVPSTIGADITLYDLRGLAYHRTVATPGFAHDLMFSVTEPFPPSGGFPISDVYRVNVANGATVKVAQVGANERGAQVFADPRGEVMLLGSQFDLTLVGYDGLSYVRGPRLDVVSALFVDLPDRRASVVASTPQSVVDVTFPDRPRILASVGGTLLGQLDDGRLVLASPAPAELVVLAVGADGSLTELGRIAGARGPAALQRFPTPTSGFRVLALRDVDPGSPGAQAVVAFDLSTGEMTDQQVLGFDATFAPEINRPGTYLFTQRGEDRIRGRGVPNFGVPAGRHPFLDPLRSWSPDGSLIAFGSQAGSGSVGLTAQTRDGRVIVDLLPKATATVQLLGWVQRR
jgi:hypothetical protein